MSEEVLSVAECGAVDNETSFVELEWRHSTLQEEGYSLRRIFLFSHCINPTNTSSVRCVYNISYSQTACGSSCIIAQFTVQE